MISLVQRCSRACVRVDGVIVGSLSAKGGLLVLLGIEVGDDARAADKMADKLRKLPPCIEPAPPLTKAASTKAARAAHPNRLFDRSHGTCRTLTQTNTLES